MAFLQFSNETNENNVHWHILEHGLTKIDKHLKNEYIFMPE